MKFFRPRSVMLLLGVAVLPLTGCKTKSVRYAAPLIEAQPASLKKPSAPVQHMTGGGSPTTTGIAGLTQSAVPTSSLIAKLPPAGSVESLPLVELPPSPSYKPMPSIWTKIGNFFRQETPVPPSKLEIGSIVGGVIGSVVGSASEAAPPSALVYQPGPITKAPPATSPPPLEKPTSAKHLGTWYRETEGVLIALKFTEKRISATITTAVSEDGKESRVTMVLEGDYTLGLDGRVYGVITNIETPGTTDESGGRPSKLLAALAVVDEPFAFRSRIDDGEMTVSNMKCADLAAIFKDEPTAALACQGKYKFLASETLPAVKAVKRVATPVRPCTPSSKATAAPPLQQAPVVPVEPQQRSENPIQLLMKPENLRMVMRLVELVK